MITLRRSAARRLVRTGAHSRWQTFWPAGPDPGAAGFGLLVALDELQIAPCGCSAGERREEAEIVSYVHVGALAPRDSTGGAGMMLAGEFQRMTVGRATHHKEVNASRTRWARVFRVGLRPVELGLALAHEQRRFAAAQRHNVLCVVASQDGRNGSLQLRQDALVGSSVLDPGRHLIHELSPGRSAWIHVVSGEAALQDIVLTHGDGAGVTDEPGVSLTAQQPTEVMLVDLGPAPGREAVVQAATGARESYEPPGSA